MMTFLSYWESHHRLGEGEVVLKVGEHTMKFDINKLMKYPSGAYEDLGVIDLSDDKGIESCIEEVIAINEEADFEELPWDEPTLELKTLPSTLKYAFINTQQAKPMIIFSQLDEEQGK